MVPQPFEDVGNGAVRKHCRHGIQGLAFQVLRERHGALVPPHGRRGDIVQVHDDVKAGRPVPEVPTERRRVRGRPCDGRGLCHLGPLRRRRQVVVIAQLHVVSRIAQELLRRRTVRTAVGLLPRRGESGTVRVAVRSRAVRTADVRRLRGVAQRSSWRRRPHADDLHVVVRVRVERSGGASDTGGEHRHAGRRHGPSSPQQRS
ncbi:hypothetical protein DFJ74DRAFT_652817 [Hyaloraphidium curvatum]|nr:hypothetical protein DFJ74DRAFT_652817 [Hyaloraphidium curvatum]